MYSNYLNYQPISYQLQRFHIKWKNFSHLHNTDETYEFLKRYKGMKRVDNYIKNVWAVERAILADSDKSPEEHEAFQIEKERRAEALEAVKVVERVICSRDKREEDGSINVQYFCKWRSTAFFVLVSYKVYLFKRVFVVLHYADATWESELPSARVEIAL